MSLFHDRTACFIVAALVLFQVVLGRWLWARTIHQLSAGTHALRAAREAVDRAQDPSALRQPAVPPAVERAARATYDGGAHEEVVTPEEAFAPERLLPREYQHRLDTAAPGTFTAIGILGTFIGLVVAFLKVSLTDPTGSIQPLLGAMTMAFVNSLLGVSFSIAWTLSSRSIRHRFDVSALELAAAVETRFGAPAPGTQVLAAFAGVRADLGAMRQDVCDALEQLAGATGALAAAQHAGNERLGAELHELRSATHGASRELLESLAPRIEQSFRGLVDLPFERLEGSVDRFRGVMDASAERHADVLAALDGSASALGAAQQELTTAVAAAHACVEEFGTANRHLRDGANAAAATVGESRRAADALRATAETIESVGQRHGQLASALGGAVTELRATAGALDAGAANFSSGAARLESAADRIGALTTDVAESTLGTVREELRTTADRMATSLQAFGDRNVAAYDAASARVVQALDERVTDLTDRLSAELHTLAARLPESAAEISNAAAKLQQRLQSAVRSLDQSVRAVDAGATQTLAARLAEYDAMVAKAADHFSGTILGWDGRIADLGTAAREFRDGMGDARQETVAALQAVTAAMAQLREAAQQQAAFAVPVAPSNGATHASSVRDAATLPGSVADRAPQALS